MSTPRARMHPLLLLVPIAVAMTGCTATPSAAPATAASSAPASAPSTAPPVATSAAPAWAFTELTDVAQCETLTPAVGPVNGGPQLADTLFGAAELELVELGLATAPVTRCEWDPGYRSPTWKASYVHTSADGSPLDGAALFETFPGTAEGIPLPSDYRSVPSGDGEIFVVEDAVCGEALPCDVAHYVEDDVVVTFVQTHATDVVTRLEGIVDLMRT